MRPDSLSTCSESLSEKTMNLRWKLLPLKLVKFHSILCMRGCATVKEHQTPDRNPCVRRHTRRITFVTLITFHAPNNRTYSVLWRPAPARSPPASQPTNSECFLRFELETFLLLVVTASRFGSSSSSSLLLSLSQAGTALVDLFLKTRPELWGLDAAPFRSGNDAETPDLGRPAPRSLSSLRRATVLLVAGVCSAALSPAGSLSLSADPVRSPGGSIVVKTRLYILKEVWNQEFISDVWKNGPHLV